MRVRVGGREITSQREGGREGGMDGGRGKEGGGRELE